ncbi:MAG: KH domain-containing protein [Candidatus Pacebacteria bacterium]|nr:KH domain-containing protein [Candidatus Paceibacterota bacterium]
MAEPAKDIEFLEFIVKTLVDHPSEVRVDRKVDEMGVLLSVKVNPEDMGQLIGREGSTARAIRNLVRIIGLKNHARVNLKIEEPEGGSRKKPAESAPVTAPQESSSVTEDFEDFKI